MKVGDFVTRDGTDVQVVVYLTEDGHSGEFKCVRVPASVWCKVDDIEYNLARRYSPVTVPIVEAM